MAGSLIYLFIALVIAALFSNPWIFIVAIGLLTVYMACGLIGILKLPDSRSKKSSSKTNKLDPPDYVMFDDLDDI